jgi:hypothetical protein
MQVNTQTAPKVIRGSLWKLMKISTGALNPMGLSKPSRLAFQTWMDTLFRSLVVAKLNGTKEARWLLGHVHFVGGMPNQSQ